jgi:hypothetical protein
VLNILVVRPEGRERPLGRSRCRWEDSIRMNLTELWFEGGNGLLCLGIRTTGRLL